MGLPVVVESNARTLVQERYNATWIEEQGLGIALRSFSDIDRAMAYLLSGSVLEEYRARVRSHKNSAIFELPDFLDGILRDAHAAAPREHAALA